MFGTGDRLERQSQAARHTALIEGFPEYVELEARAAEIRLYEVGVVPGLLQTPEYAAALQEGGVRRGEITTEQAQERVDLVARRKAALWEGRRPPLVFVVLGEGCVLRSVGDAGVMRDQLHELVRFAQLPTAVLQVAPFTLGSRLPLSLPLYVLTMQNRTLISYAESAHQGHMEREAASVLPRLTSYRQLQAEALSQADSVAMIEQIGKGYRDI